MLWVRPADARPVVSDGLTSMGAIVDDCIAYKTVMETEDPTGAVKLFTESGADIVTFASASAAENFKALDLPWPEGCKVASIGPVTSTALAGMGMVPHIEAREHNIPVTSYATYLLRICWSFLLLFIRCISGEANEVRPLGGICSCFDNRNGWWDSSEYVDG